MPSEGAPESLNPSINTMDIKKLLVRTLSGLVYCLIVVGSILLGEQGVLALAILFSLLASLEFTKICGDLSAGRWPAILLDTLGCVALCFSFLIYPLVAWGFIILLRFILELYMHEERPIRSLAMSMLTQIYVGVPMALMVAIGWLWHPVMLLALFLFIWINDTGAFLVGSAIGRHKLFPRISPAKSWEGFFGGFLFCLGLGALFGYSFETYFGEVPGIAAPWGWIVMGGIASLFATWGDLVESMFKRSLHIKDSGHIMPGHGGILDRLDSLLMVLPAVSLIFFTIYALR